MEMATGCDTKATQTTEDEEEDYSHLTEKDINFKCAEGIGARLDKFAVVHKKAFVIRLELNGKFYDGCFLEAIDSFAPVNLSKSKRRRPGRPVNNKRSKGRQCNDKNKNPNAYSRENFPQGYVDPSNTIEERLRFGRDKRIRELNTSTVAGSSSSNSKDDSVLGRKNRKKESHCSVENSASNEGYPIHNCKYKTKRKYLKESLKSNENEKISEATSKENSLPTYSTVMKGYNSTPINCNPYEEISVTSSDGSFCSPVFVQSISSRNKEQTAVNHMRLDNTIKSIDHNLGSAYVAYKPRVNRKSQSKNNDCGVQSTASTSSQASLSRTSEPDLITFSPLVNTGKPCRKDHETVQSVAAWSQSPEPDLIIFSPKISTESHRKENAIQRPSGIHAPKNKCNGLNLLFSHKENQIIQDINDRIEVACTSSKTISPEFFHKKSVYGLEKFGDVQYIEGDGNTLNTNEKLLGQFTESKLQITVGVKELSINDRISEKIDSDKDASISSELKLQCNPKNVDEIQTKDSNSFVVRNLNKDVFHHFHCSQSYEKTVGISPGIDWERTSAIKFHKRFESTLKGNTRDVPDQTNKQRFSGDMSVRLQPIPQNKSKEEIIRSFSDDKDKKSGKMSGKMKIHNLQLSEQSFPDNYEIRCTNDNTDLGKISLKFSCPIYLEHEKPNCSRTKKTEPCFSENSAETPNCSRTKETESCFSENSAENSISSECATHPRSAHRLKHAQRDVETKLSRNSDAFSEDVLVDSCYKSEYKPQSGFKDDESIHILEDSTVPCQARNEIHNSEMSGRIEVQCSFDEEKPNKNVVENELQSDSRENDKCAAKSLEDALDSNILDKIKMLINTKKTKSTGSR